MEAEYVALLGQATEGRGDPVAWCRDWIVALKACKTAGVLIIEGPLVVGKFSNIVGTKWDVSWAKNRKNELILED